MAKRKYTAEERQRLGIESKKRKYREFEERPKKSRIIYDDEVQPRKTANFDYDDQEEYEDESTGGELFIIAGALLLALAIFTM